MRFTCFLLATLVLAGCEAGTPEHLTPSQMARIEQLVNAEPWQLSGRFAGWEIRDLMPNGRVYLEHDTPNDPSRGPALLSEIVEGVVSTSQLKDAVEQEYSRRPAGKVVRVWVDEAGMFIFEASYDVDLSSGLGRVPFHFHCVGRVARLRDREGIAVLTYTKRANEFDAREVPKIAAEMKQQVLK